MGDELLRYHVEDIDPNALQLGAHYDHVDYCWRPFEERRPDHQADYVRLEADIRANGIKNPLITHNGCVLIGQRRCEIARKLGLGRVPCIVIDDDISADPNADRVLALVATYQPAPY